MLVSSFWLKLDSTILKRSGSKITEACRVLAACVKKGQ